MSEGAGGGRRIAAPMALLLRGLGHLREPGSLWHKLPALVRRWRAGRRYRSLLARGGFIQEIQRHGEGMLITVATPVYRVAEEHLRAAIASVRQQSHGAWELLLLDDASPDSHVPRVLAEAAAGDGRIRTWRRTGNAGIAAASDEIVARAQGEFVAFLDHDDLIHPRALELVSAFLDGHGEVDWLFTDEDKVSASGVHHQPCLKPGWSRHLLHTFNYVTHLRVIRRALLDRMGGHRQGFTGAQDYDLALRALAAGARFAHLPGVLYHWRTVPTSMARAAATKPAAHGAARRALADHAETWGRGGAVSVELRHGPSSFFQLRRAPDPALPLVSLLPMGWDELATPGLRREIASLPLPAAGLDPAVMMEAIASATADVVLLPPPSGLTAEQVQELLSLLQVPGTALVAGRAMAGRRVAASGWVASHDGSLRDPWAGLGRHESGYLNLAWVTGPRLAPPPWGWAAWREELVAAWMAARDLDPAWRLPVGCARLGLEVVTTPTVSFPRGPAQPRPPSLPIPDEVPRHWPRWLDDLGLAHRDTITVEAP